MSKQIVTLNQDVKTLANQFVAGQTFRVLGGQGTLVRLSRVGDNAKLTTLPEYVGLSRVSSWTPSEYAGVEAAAAADLVAIVKSNQRYNAPHSDASGASRAVTIASCLAGRDSGHIVMHFTPAEEREYNSGMARLAEMG